MGTKNEGDFCDYVTEVVTLAGEKKSIGIQVTTATTDYEDGPVKFKFAKTFEDITYTLDRGMILIPPSAIESLRNFKKDSDLSLHPWASYRRPGSMTHTLNPFKLSKS